MAGRYNRKDHFYQQAKSSGLRSRAAFKLEELNQKYKLIERGSKILDLGAWPGGWMQVAAKKLGSKGLLVGIDLKEIEDFQDQNIEVITGDVRDEHILQQAAELAAGKFDLILSDMSPKISGIKEVDQAASVGCAELALWVAQNMLRSGGCLVIKVFKGSGTEEFVKEMRPMFNKLVRSELKSTRKTSQEFYLIGFGLKAQGDGITS